MGERLKKFDLEDFDGYMEFVVKDTSNSDFGNFLYQVHVHGDLVFSAEGYEDYYNKLKGILESYAEKKVDRFHEILLCLRDQNLMHQMARKYLYAVDFTKVFGF